MTSDDGGTVVPFPGTEPPEDGFPISRERADWHCQHPRVTLMEVERSVVCTDCGATLEAWAILQRWTLEWERLSGRYKTIRQDIETAQTRLDSLLRRERNARARLARVLGKSEPVARVVDAARAYVDARTARDYGRALDAYLALSVAVDGVE